MTNSGLSGPYRLNFDAIAAVVTRTAAGVYALGHAGPNGKFCVNRIGRCDCDVRSRLLGFIGSDALFKYDYFPSSRAAFERECELFHDIAPPRNLVHPDRPKGTTWECPRCRIFVRR